MSEKSDSVKYAWWIEDEKIALVSGKAYCK